MDVKPKCVLVSACLLGEKCKYNGGHNYNQALVDYVADKEVVAICPEVLAGLPTPREPVELVDGHVLDKRGNCYDDLFDKNKADIIELIRHDPEKGEQAADMLMVAKYFERIGDHATNIAEWVIFALNDKKEIKES